MRNMRNRSFKKPEDQGFILIFAVIIMTFLLLLAVPFLFQQSNEQKLTEKSFKSLAASSLAEAGVERAIWELNNGNISNWEGNYLQRTLTISNFQASGGDVVGDIEIEVMYPYEGYPVIEAAGKVAFVGQLPVSRLTRVVLKSSGCHPLFDYSVFGNNEVGLGSYSFIDSYDSRNGLYGGTNVSSNGSVGTNATDYGCISLDNSAIIYGNAFSGPQSEPELVIITWFNSHIFGAKQSLSSPKDMPSVLPPENLPFMGDYYLDSYQTDVISQSGEYDSFRLNSDAEATIANDVTLYVKGDFEIGSQAKLVIAENSSGKIYLGGGNFTLGEESEIINLTQDPKRLLILGTDYFNQIVDLSLYNDFYGAVYAPRANLNCNFAASFYGSLVANMVSLSTFSEVHYDKALADIQIPTTGKGSIYSIMSWQQRFLR